MTPLALAQIQALHDKLAEESQKPDPDARWFATANLEFHRVVCEATRNQLLREFMARIYDTMGRFIHNSFRQPARVAEVVEEHTRLVAALAARDAGAAEHWARAHMERALEARLALHRAQHRTASERARR
jgi:DNA-binding FadR family transcriptional regulator